MQGCNVPPFLDNKLKGHQGFFPFSQLPLWLHPLRFFGLWSCVLIYYSKFPMKALFLILSFRIWIIYQTLLSSIQEWAFQFYNLSRLLYFLISLYYSKLVRGHYYRLHCPLHHFKICHVFLYTMVVVQFYYLCCTNAHNDEREKGNAM